MPFIERNIVYDDCMVVALHNAAVAVGKKSEYHKLMDVSTKKGWYVRHVSFKCKHLDDAFKHLKVKANLVQGAVKTKELFKSIVEQNKVYLFFRPSEYGIAGHAMVAIKGEKGVKVLNPYLTGKGWRSMSKEIRSGKSYYIIEIQR